MANAVKSLCTSLPISKIISITISGYSARIISSQRLPQPILAVCNNPDQARSFNIYENTKGIYYKTKFFTNNLDHIPKCLKFLWQTKKISSKDMIIVVALVYPSGGRRMNLIQTHYVSDLVKTLSWK